MFRNQLPDHFVPVFMDKVSDFLTSDSPVNQSYAAATIEKLLLRKVTNSDQPIFTPENVTQEIITKLL